MKYLFLIICIFALHNGYSQVSSDAQLVSEADFTNHRYDKRVVRFGFDKSKHFFIRYNPVSLVFATAMYGYQKVISQQLMSSCLYSPSCSEFGKNLIAHYGIIKGIPFTADRLMRCNRMAISDMRNFDPRKKTKEDVSLYSRHNH